MKMLCLFLAVMQPLVCLIASQSIVSESQMNALQLFYNTTNGPHWTWRQNYSLYGQPWNFLNDSSVNSGNPCRGNWQGVTCTANCSAMPACDIIGLELQQFNLTGTLSSSLVGLTQLNILNLAANSLYGTIPPDVGDLITLSQIIMPFNYLSGSLPATIGQISSLSVLDLATNMLTGALPSTLGALSQLTQLVMSFNYGLTGSIPSSLGSCPIRVLSFASSQLSGTLPATLASNWHLLVAFSVRDNLFTGPFPTQLLQGPLIAYVLISNNFFSGSFENLQIMSSGLSVFRLNNNMFTGPSPLPLVCGQPMLDLLLNDNLFTGTIPTCVGTLRILEDLDLSANLLEGSLPSQMNQLYTLETLVLHSNYFTGQVTNIFNNDKLDALVIGDNYFTGLLPADVFNSTALHTFIASKNCFTGSISSGMCHAVNLKTLALSGLAGASRCTTKFLFGAYSVLTTPGTLPSCLFSMPELTQLFAAGNKISGQLYDLPADSKLQNLTLSYNRLHGKIPQSIERHTGFQVLDLSFNSLVGTVENMVNYSLSTANNMGVSSDQQQQHQQSTDVYLERNLLSGTIPSSFVHATTTVNILNGNMFECKTTRELPQNDPRAHSYSCGSDLLDVFLYLWVALVGILAIGVLWHLFVSVDEIDVMGEQFKIADTVRAMWLFLSYKPSRASLKMNRGAAATADVLIRQSNMVMAQFRKFCLRVTVIITLVFLPIFTLFSYADEDTGYAQTYQYGWSISMGFIKGESAAVVVAVMWSALLIYCMHFEATFIDRTPISITASPILHAKLTSDSMSSITAAAATAATAVTAAASATTIEVIDSVDKVSEDKQCNEGVGVQDEDEPEILPTPVVVSVPALWRKALVVTANILGTLAANSLYVWIVLTQSLVVQVIAAACFVVYKLLFMYLVLVPWMERVESKFIVILSVVLMNFIIIPMLATLAMDVSCFESLFVQAPPIVTDYSYLSCSLFTGATIEDATCADYRPIELQLSIPAPFIYSDMCFTAVLTNYVPIYVLTYGVIGLLVPVIQIVTTIHFANAAVTQDQKMLAWIHKMKTIEWFPIFYLFPLESIHDMVAPDNTIKKHFYLSRFNSLNCVLLLTILLSFGATYSPLAIMVLLNITLTTLAFQLSIYYHSQQIRLLPVECMEPWSAVLTAEIRDMHKIVFGSRTAIYIFSSLFVACGVYEMSEILNFPLTISLMVGVIVVAVVGTRVLKYRRATALQQYNQMVDTVSKRRRSSTGGNSARVSRGDINDGVGNGGVFDSGDKRINDSTNDVSIELAGICTATVTADGGSCDNDSVDCVDDVDVIINPLCAAPTDDVEPAAVLQ